MKHPSKTGALLPFGKSQRVPGLPTRSDPHKWHRHEQLDLWSFGSSRVPCGIKSMDSRLGMGIRGFIPRGTCFGVVGTHYEKS